MAEVEGTSAQAQLRQQSHKLEGSDLLLHPAEACGVDLAVSNIFTMAMSPSRRVQGSHVSPPPFRAVEETLVQNTRTPHF